MKVLVHRQKARLTLQHALKWKLRQKAVLKEIDRRVFQKAEFAVRARLQAIEEAKEVNILKRQKGDLGSQVE